MRESKSSYSLSHYFDLLNRKKQTIIRQARGIFPSPSPDIQAIREISPDISLPSRQERETCPPQEEFSTGLNILKTLKNSEDQRLTLMGLSKAVGVKIGVCQEIADRLQDEGLIDIEEDQDTGNDNILLTRKGRELL